jgi:hypothetical protein
MDANDDKFPQFETAKSMAESFVNSSALSAKSARLQKSGGDTGGDPVMSIVSSGTLYEDRGMNVDAISAGHLSSGSILFGSITDESTGITKNLTPIVLDGDAQPGWLIYPMVKNRSLVWTESNGPFTFRMFTYSNGQMSVSTSVKNVWDQSKFIEHVETSVSPKGHYLITMTGNFGNKAGVSRLLQVDGNYAYDVPVSAVKVAKNKLVIDMTEAQLEWLPIANLAISVVNKFGDNDTAYMRYNPPATAMAAAEANLSARKPADEDQ